MNKVSQFVSHWLGSVRPAGVGQKGTSLILLSATLLIAGGFVTWYCSRAWPVLLRVLDRPERALLLDRGGVRLDPVYASFLESLVVDIRMQSQPNQAILCLPYLPMFYFLSERRNPTRWNYLWPGDQTRDDHKALIRQAQNDPPALVLIWQKDQLHSYAPIIMNYIEEKFRIARTEDGFTFYLPLNP